jgi:hypothetical protein
MSPGTGLLLAGSVAILGLVLLLVLVRSIQRRSRGSMSPGWVMLGRGAIWADRENGPPGAFITIAAALPNTLSLSLRPASNQAWRCPGCQMLLLDHSRLVRPRR